MNSGLLETDEFLYFTVIQHILIFQLINFFLVNFYALGNETVNKVQQIFLFFFFVLRLFDELLNCHHFIMKKENG